MHTPRHPKGPSVSSHGAGSDRRTALALMSAAVASAAWPAGLDAAAREPRPGLQSNDSKTRLRKIATEEAFTIPEIAAGVRDAVRRGGSNLDLKLLRLVYDAPPQTLPAVRSAPPLTATRSLVRFCRACWISATGGWPTWTRTASTCTSCR
jgi:hypothetical protein